MPRSNATVYEPLPNPTGDRTTKNGTQTHDSNLSVPPTTYSELSSPVTSVDAHPGSTALDMSLPEDHFILLDDLGQPSYGENEHMGTENRALDSVGDLFSECLFPMASEETPSRQTQTRNPGFCSSQRPNQPHAGGYISTGEDYIVLGQDEDVADSSSDFLDVGLESGHPTLNPPADARLSCSNSDNSSEWSHLALESDSNGRATPHSRSTEISSVPNSGDSAPTTTGSGIARKRRVRGQFRTVELREKTSQTRKLGACIRCKMQRVRVRFSQHNILSRCRMLTALSVRSTTTTRPEFAIRAKTSLSLPYTSCSACAGN